MKKFLSIIAIMTLAGATCPTALADDFEPAEEEENSSNQFILDADNTGGDITLQFGGSMNEYLEWNDTGSSFDFSGDILVLDADNTGAGANVSIIAEQGSDNDGELRYNATTNQWEYSNDGGSFLAIGSGGGGGGTAEYFDAYDSAGGTDISSGYTDIPLGTERKKTTDFTHLAGSAEVTINTTGTYVVNFAITTDATSGTNRSESEMRLMLDTGGGYVQIPGSIGRIYNRTAAQGEGTATRSVILDLSAGDKLKTQASRISGTNTITTLAGGSALVISRVEGVGTQGPQGPQGPSGSNTLIIQDESVNVTNTPHSSLNFVGTGVAVTDAGSGVATITISDSTVIKGGKLTVNDQSWTAVSFNTSFTSIPNVTVTVDHSSPEDLKRVYIKNVTASGFSVYIKNKNGGQMDIQWIATDAGNP